MAYISTEEVREIRNNLKKEFPEFKFGVRKGYRGISVNVVIKSGPVDFGLSEFGRDHMQINHYHLGNYQNSDILKGMLDIINVNNYNNSQIEYDIHDVGYYVHLNVGNWNKPYEVKK